MTLYQPIAPDPTTEATAFTNEYATGFALPETLDPHGPLAPQVVVRVPAVPVMPAHIRRNACVIVAVVVIFAVGVYLGCLMDTPLGLGIITVVTAGIAVSGWQSAPVAGDAKGGK